MNHEVVVMFGHPGLLDGNLPEVWTMFPLDLIPAAQVVKEVH